MSVAPSEDEHDREQGREQLTSEVERGDPPEPQPDYQRQREVVLRGRSSRPTHASATPTASVGE